MRIYALAGDKYRMINKSIKKSGYWKFVILIWVCFLGLGSLLCGSLIAAYYGWFGPLPDFEELENPKSILASEVYSADTVLLGKYFYEENRSNATYEELSPHIINALIATEDIRFENHSGIDTKGLLRVFIKTVILGMDAGGGSTITQQLAKNLFHEKPTSKIERIKQKLKEWIIAVKLEKSYTKKEIITNYLNTVAFSGHSFGIKSAALEFFSASTDSLKIEEAAVLIGMLKATGTFNPVRNPDNSLRRRNIVISQMAKYGFIEQELADSLQQQPITLKYKSSSHDKGIARYFREHLRMELRKWCKEHNYNLYEDGLKIYTTIDSRMQKYAEDAVNAHLKVLQKDFFEHWKKRGDPWGKNTQYLKQAMRQSDRYRKLIKQGITVDSIMKVFHTPDTMTVFSWNGEKDTIMSPWDSLRYYKYHLQSGFMVMEPATGYIKAWVGGANFKYFKFDHVLSKRQIGSTFKPFVYSVAIDNGWSPCQKLPNIPVTFEKGDEFGLIKSWTPKNADDKWEGEMISLQKGLAHSINIITARLMQELKPAPIVERVKRMGVESDIPPYPSICLGTPDISVYEMVGAYSTFVNRGFYIKPSFISRIEDKNGNVIPGFLPKKVEVMNEQTAYIMIKMLQSVVNEGTAIRLRYRYKFNNDIIGKTGTTQEHADGWFIGAIPQLVGGIWTGGDDRTVRFRSIQYGQGANMALPIFAGFLQKIYDDSTLNIIKDTTFQKPLEPLTIELDCSKYIQSSTHKGEFKYENIYDKK